MAEPIFQIVERAGTPILNGAGASARPADDTRAELEPTVVTVTLRHTGQEVTWNELYPTAFGRSGLVARAQTLLADGQQRLSTALDYVRDDDFIRADYEITLFQGTLPELFCCNSIGEGFATIVVALRWALKNRRGDPLSSDQLNAVIKCVMRLNKELFMKYDAALDLIDDLENVGLNTDISVAAPLAELLAEETNEPAAE